jgi:TonB-dependent SusC/RagA subfamily outer membrane receptor
LLFNCRNAIIAQAQGVAITGKTTDQATGEPLPRVTIMVRGTTVGTTSLAGGTYSLPVPAGGTALVFSFVGYQTQEVTISGRTVIDVGLQQESQLLQEVVVTGYSVERKRDIIGSVPIVNTKEMLSTPSRNVIDQLQRRVSGLTISSDGSVNNAAKVRIRGFGSFSRSDPLYIIDGVPGNASNLNPNDIESVQVLKDGASATVYGACVANGVTIITTTHGIKDAVKFNIDSYYGMNSVDKSHFPDMLDTQEWADVYWKAMSGTDGVSGSENWTHSQFGNGATPVIPEYILVNDHCY